MPIIINRRDTELPPNLVFPECPIGAGERAEYIREKGEQPQVIAPEIAALHIIRTAGYDLKTRKIIL